LRKRRGGTFDDRQLTFDIQFYKPEQDKLQTEWDNVAEREKRSRTVFAQESIKVDDVRRELDAIRAAIGSGVDVARFDRQAVEAHHGTFSGEKPSRIGFKEAPRPLREMLHLASDEIKVRFELPVKDDELYLSRTHPIVEVLSTYIMDTAFDPVCNGVAKRSGAIRTSRVSQRTTCVLMRFRYHIITARKKTSTLCWPRTVRLQLFPVRRPTPNSAPSYGRRRQKLRRSLLTSRRSRDSAICFGPRRNES